MYSPFLTMTTAITHISYNAEHPEAREEFAAIAARNSVPDPRIGTVIEEVHALKKTIHTLVSSADIHGHTPQKNRITRIDAPNLQPDALDAIRQHVARIKWIQSMTRGQ